MYSSTSDDDIPIVALGKSKSRSSRFPTEKCGPATRTQSNHSASFRKTSNSSPNQASVSSSEDDIALVAARRQDSGKEAKYSS